MPLYAGSSPQRARQIVGDLAVLTWTVLWLILSRVIDQAIRALAEPARRIAERGAEVGASLDVAVQQTSRVPGLGEEISRPFVSASGSVTQMVGAARDQAALIETLATVVGVLTVVVPVLLALLVWLPGRIRFVRAARAARRLLDRGADLDLFALRALATQPLAVLSTLAADPAASWRAGDPEVIATLAALELRRYGLDAPAVTTSGGSPSEP